MKRYALLGAVAASAFAATSALAAGVYVNGVYTESGGTVTLPADGTLTITPTGVAGGTTPTFGTAPVAVSAPTYHSAPTYGGSGQYQVLDSATTYEAAPVQTYETMPVQTHQAAPVATYEAQQAPNIIIRNAPAPVAAAPVAAAPAKSGWGRSRIYIAPRVIGVIPRDTEFTLREQGQPPIRIINGYDNLGYGGSVAVGYQASPMGWGVNVRTEIEGGYQSQSVDSHDLAGIGSFSGDDALGDTSVLYGFVNAYADVPVASRLGVTVGGGLGLGQVKFDGHGVRGAGDALDDSATAFGYHLDAGVSYDVTDAITLEAMYRYQSFVGAELTTTSGNTEEVDLDSHNVLIGARVGF